MTHPMDPPAKHRTELGPTVRRLRRARGLTLHQLADELAVSAATVSAIENGKTGVSTERLSHIAHVLDVSVEQLFEGFSNDPEYAPPPRPRSTESSQEDSTKNRGWWRGFPPLELNAVLSGALSSFLEFGYHGASMRTVAERANISVPGLYHYYPSKHDMLVALLDLTLNDLLDRTRAARDEGGDNVVRFTNVVECLALFHTHRRDLAFVGASELRSLSPQARRWADALRAEVQGVLEVEVADGVRSGRFLTTQPHDATRAVVALCTALAQWFRDEGPATAEHVATQYTGFALDLVRCDPRYRPEHTR